MISKSFKDMKCNIGFFGLTRSPAQNTIAEIKQKQNRGEPGYQCLVNIFMPKQTYKCMLLCYLLHMGTHNALLIIQ